MRITKKGKEDTPHLPFHLCTFDTFADEELDEGDGSDAGGGQDEMFFADEEPDEGDG